MGTTTSIVKLEAAGMRAAVHLAWTHAAVKPPKKWVSGIDTEITSDLNCGLQIVKITNVAGVGSYLS